MVDSAIVAKRKTFDGVVVFLHANGEMSDHLNFIKGGKLPAAVMWRFAADVCLYTHAELPNLIRAAKRGEWRPFRIWKDRAAAFENACAHNAHARDLGGVSYDPVRGIIFNRGIS